MIKRCFSCSVFLLLCLVGQVWSDIYLHNPRGSNNRLNEKTRNRKNQRRLFDSENNGRGGYNVGVNSLSYYVGSVLQVEWTQQHGCSDPNNNCEVVLQYMCSENLRDGTTTSSIAGCRNSDCNTKTHFGMHENYEYYKNCDYRSRNRGLFTADQLQNNRNSRKNRARHTRQNSNGQFSGYECPEERDYYPYWHPTPWKDIAVLTSNPSRCAYYRAESENVKGRGYCKIPPEAMRRQNAIPVTEQECKDFLFPPRGRKSKKVGEWKESSPFGIPAPECREADITRPNHLGDGIDGQVISYNWTIPDDINEHCALRIRYNISTKDYNGWDGATTSAQNTPTGGKSPLSLPASLGFTSDEQARDRGYEFTNDPTVELFEGFNVDLQLNINTAQLGRTFQDRSHTFAIIPRPSSVPASAKIHNLNVRGRRGNIVQVYPAVEYDYSPTTTVAQQGDYVHIQWTGSLTTPAGAGNGRESTDKSNIVQLAERVFPPQAVPDPILTQHGNLGRNYPALLTNTELFGFTLDQRRHLAFSTKNTNFRGNYRDLDGSDAYFDLGIQPLETEGYFNFFCTRNNEFTNRNQLGQVQVNPFETWDDSIGINGRTVVMSNRELVLTANPGTFNTLTKVRVELWPVNWALKVFQTRGGDSALSAARNFQIVGKFVNIDPQDLTTASGAAMDVELAVSSGSSAVKVYRTDEAFIGRTELRGTQVNNGRVSFSVSRGGLYFVAVP